MSKTKNDRDAKKPVASDKDAKPADGGWRETVESVAMAVILALLFRGFVAEAFVIPTGSMAPTLQGRHKDVKCPKCGMRYQVSGSVEQSEDRPSGKYVYTGTCPVCRYTHTLNPLKKPNEGSFSGDRIIVGKFCYDLGEPQRRDVIVFKYPNNAVQNYIKRLIGLPGETVRIAGGNIYVRGAQDAAEHIARKPPHKLDALLQLVDDTDHIPQELIDIGWPSRWQPWPASEAKAAAWEKLNGGRAYVCKGDQPEEVWLRYRNLAPSYADWETIELNHQLPSDAGQRPGRLITDFYAYNTERWKYSTVEKSWPMPSSYDPPNQIEQHAGPGDPSPAETLGQHWVDDLAVECLADVTGKQGELSLLLVRGGVKHVCRINLADGKATLSMTNPDGTSQEFLGDDGKTAANPTAKTNVVGPGRYRLRLANCDHEMVLWVNGSVVNFDGPTTYKSADLIAPAYSATDPGDLAPAGISATGAAVKVSRLRVYRDKYYIAVDGGSEINDYIRSPRIPGATGSDAELIQRIFADPTLWESTKFFEPENRRWVNFKLEQDQFLPMGDNSPQSSDGRFWFDHHYVERDLLIGKALLIYWPHTWNRPVPFTPNFSKMGPIR